MYSVLSMLTILAIWIVCADATHPAVQDGTRRPGAGSFLGSPGQWASQISHDHWIGSLAALAALSAQAGSQYWATPKVTQSPAISLATRAAAAQGRQISLALRPPCICTPSFSSTPNQIRARTVNSHCTLRPIHPGALLSYRPGNLSQRTRAGAQHQLRHRHTPVATARPVQQGAAGAPQGWEVGSF
jgi:hypothetical protein